MERVEELENDNNNEGSNSNENGIIPMRRRTRSYQRNTPSQLKELDNLFRRNQHPNEQQRRELGTRISLNSRQIQIWFQNKRSHLKARLERHENNLFKQNKTNIQLENLKLKELLKTSLCTKCNGSRNPSDHNSVEEHRLKLKIHHLTEELSKMTGLAQRCLGRPIMSFDLSNSAPIGQVVPAPLPPVMPTISLAGDVSQNQLENSPFLKLAEKAMEELTKLVSINSPLWTQTGCEEGGGGVVVETLNLEEYIKSFPPCLETKPDKNSTRYATRASGIVAARSSSILNSLMDENQWTDLFPCIIGKTSIIDIIIQAGNRTLQVMDAELQALSPIVPVWKVKFIRFCRQIAEGVWGMVDVSIELAETSSIVNCRRFPSGCVLQEMPNNFSRVTWVEHLDYEENEVIHPLGVMSCSPSFGAQRWLASLQRQCLCLAIISSPPASTHDQTSGMVSHSTKRSMVSMAHRMVRSFGFGLCSTVHQWKLVQAGETRLTIRNNNNIDNPGEPTGVVLCATNSVRMPLSHRCLFDFLSNKHRRGDWEEVQYTMPIQELARINKSNDDELNRVSFLRTTVLIDRNNQKIVPIVQETQSDESGSMLVYGMVNLPVMQVVMSGQDSSSVEILPNGFSIIPNIRRRGCEEDSCTMTVAFQILTKNSPGNMNISMELIQYINNLMSQRIRRIKSALHCG